MITFTSIADLDKLANDDPAKCAIKQLLEWLIADGDFPDHPYLFRQVSLAVEVHDGSSGGGCHSGGN